MDAIKIDARSKVQEIWILVHGVESNALGMEALRGAMYESDDFPFETCRVKVHRYYRFPVVCALIKSFKEAYSDALYYYIKTQYLKYPNLKKLNIIAHSWGTFLICNAVRKFTNLYLEKLVMLGGVLPQNTSIYLPRAANVINFTGSSDKVVLAAGLFKGYGLSGRLGLQTEWRGTDGRLIAYAKKIKNIKTDWNHTDYAKQENIKEIIKKLKD